MGFKSIKNDGGMMKPGDYEVYVKSCSYATTQSGNECIKFEFVVRDDIAQDYQKKHVFKNFWPNRDTGLYPADKIGKYADSLGIEPGTVFELEDLIGCTCILHIGRFTGQDGTERECIQYTARSQAAPLIQAAPTNTFNVMDGDDDTDLPF